MLSGSSLYFRWNTLARFLLLFYENVAGVGVAPTIFWVWTRRDTVSPPRESLL